MVGLQETAAVDVDVVFCHRKLRQQFCCSGDVELSLVFRSQDSAIVSGCGSSH